MATKLELISHHLCPYVQRAVIVLSEKRVRFERHYIDFANKPDWFLALSPLGKVPLLKTPHGVLFESAVIVEYLDETVGPPLHPREPFQRARHRAWMEFGSALLNDIRLFYTALDAEGFEHQRQALRRRFEQLEAQLGAGPYFSGADFSLVDAVFGPVFRYWEVFDEIGDFGTFSGLPKVGAWRTALAARPSVRDAVTQDYPQRLWSFLANRDSHLASLLSGTPRAAVY